MSRVESVEKQIEEFSEHELAAFRIWYASFDTKAWDSQFEADVKAGKHVGEDSNRNRGDETNGHIVMEAGT